MCMCMQTHAPGVGGEAKTTEQAVEQSDWSKACKSYGLLHNPDNVSLPGVTCTEQFFRWSHNTSEMQLSYTPLHTLKKNYNIISISSICMTSAIDYIVHTHTMVANAMPTQEYTSYI